GAVGATNTKPKEQDELCLKAKVPNRYRFPARLTPRRLGERLSAPLSQRGRVRENRPIRNAARKVWAGAAARTAGGRYALGPLSTLGLIAAGGPQVALAPARAAGAIGRTPGHPEAGK
ncbi:Hypothetical predicted protein, partial [Marmota monax]